MRPLCPQPGYGAPPPPPGAGAANGAAPLAAQMNQLGLGGGGPQQPPQPGRPAAHNVIAGGFNRLWGTESVDLMQVGFESRRRQKFSARGGDSGGGVYGVWGGENCGCGGFDGFWYCLVVIDVAFSGDCFQAFTTKLS